MSSYMLVIHAGHTCRFRMMPNIFAIAAQSGVFTNPQIFCLTMPKYTRNSYRVLSCWTGLGWACCDRVLHRCSLGEVACDTVSHRASATSEKSEIYERSLRGNKTNERAMVELQENYGQRSREQEARTNESIFHDTWVYRSIVSVSTFRTIPLESFQPFRSLPCRGDTLLRPARAHPPVERPQTVPGIPAGVGVCFSNRGKTIIGPPSRSSMQSAQPPFFSLLFFSQDRKPPRTRPQ